MLHLRRKKGQSVTLTDVAGHVCRVDVSKVEGVRGHEEITLSFHDPERHFEIDRPDRKGRFDGPPVAYLEGPARPAAIDGPA